MSEPVWVHTGYPRGKWPRPDTTAERFVKFYDEGAPDACWEWKGSRRTTGYGQFSRRGRPDAAHRVAWELVNGPIPDGLTIDHLCRNRLCVNPNHMEVVTGAENSRRGATKTHCLNGHDMKDAYVYPDGHRRECHVCKIARVKAWRERAA